MEVTGESESGNMGSDARVQALSGFGGKTERTQGFCFLVNEVTGKDAGGQDRTVRFFTVPAVVDDSVMKFPYLLGGELTNRLRLSYEDEEVMSMWSHYGELRVQRLDGQTVLKKVNSRINAGLVSEELVGQNAEKGVNSVEDEEDERGAIKKDEEKRPSKEAIERNDWSPQSFTLTWMEAKSQKTVKVSYESNVFKHIGEYLVSARLREVIPTMAQFTVKLKEEDTKPYKFPAFRKSSKETKGGIEQVFRGCIECVINNGLCQRHPKNTKLCDQCYKQRGRVTPKLRCF